MSAYLFRNFGTRVDVIRPGEKEPFASPPTLQEAFDMADADKIERAWIEGERRMEDIGRNGNEGLHYPENNSMIIGR